MNICVFCDYNSSDWDSLKKHLMQHMKLPYLCDVCDGNVGRQHKIECPKHMDKDDIVFDLEELDFSMFWVWNFIEYSKIDMIKYFKKPMDGCVVCKNIINMGYKTETVDSFFEGKYETSVVKKHLSSHLRYYRYYCNECKFISSRQNVANHIKRNHQVEDVDRVCRQAKPLKKLEQLINLSKEKFFEAREKYRENNPAKVNGNVVNNQEMEEINCHKSELSETNGFSNLVDNGESASICSSDLILKQSYDINLKECSVILHRLSNEEIVAHKAQMCNTVDLKENNNENELLVKSEPRIVDEEIEIPEVVDDQKETTENHAFICIFCSSTKLKSYEEACEHYQIHLEYYPLKCSLCDEVNLNLKGLFKHFRKEHKNETKAIFQRSENEVISRWVQSFLDFQMKNANSFPIKSLCPLCELLHKEVASHPFYQTFPKLLIKHILQHICYEPFVCVDCYRDNVLVTFIQLDSQNVYNHVLRKHREKINLDLGTIIKKNRKIAILEKFIQQYLLVKGIEFKEKIACKIPNIVISKFEQKEKEKNMRIETLREKFLKPKMIAESHLATNSNLEIINKDSKNTLKPPLEQKPKEKNELITVNNVQNIFKTQVTSANMNEKRKPVKKSIAPSLIIDVSPSAAQVNSENPYIYHYFCVFCENKTFFSSKLDACSHIAEHLNYYPVVCLFCSSKFADLKSLMSHHIETHANTSSPWGEDPSSSLLYVVNEDEEMERWIEDFLDFQNSSKSWNLFCASFKQDCPVCKKLLIDFPSSFTHLKTDLSFQQHLHQHLNYYPYECVLCKKENKSTRLPLVDRTSSQHLRHHGINCKDSLNNFFLKTTTIKAVELLISETIVKNSLCQSGTDKTLNFVEQNELTSSNPVKETEFSKNINTFDLNVSPVTGCKELTTERLEIDSVRCYHCQVVLNGWLQLKEHHYRIHPGLSLIGYN